MLMNTDADFIFQRTMWKLGLRSIMSRIISRPIL